MESDSSDTPLGYISNSDITGNEKSNPARIASVNAAVGVLNRKYGTTGKLAVMKASDMPDRERVPSGIYSLDRAMDGGPPFGQFTVVAGQIGSGKSTLCYKYIGSAQTMGKRTTYLDAENRFNKAWAQKQGVDLDKLVLIQPTGSTTAEDMLQFLLDRTKDGSTDLIVLDSVSALSPRREFENDIEKESMALAPALLSKFFRMVVGAAGSANGGKGVCGLFVTQYRETLNMYATGLGKVPGGNALKSYAQYILACSARSPKEDNRITKETGFVMSVQLLKMAGSTRGTLEFEFEHGIGIDPVCDIIDNAIKLGIIEKQGGGYYQFVDAQGTLVRIRGAKATIDAIRESPGNVAAIRNELDSRTIVAEEPILEDGNIEETVEE